MIHLINPSEREILDNAGDRIPMGLLSIASTLQKKNKDVRVFDLNHMSFKEYYKKFEKDNPEAVGISVYTSPSLTESIYLSEMLHGTKLIAGGYHASAMPDSLTKHFDSVVIGEGENSFLEAINNNGIILNNPPNLDRLPKLDFGLLDMSNYGLNQSGKRTATMTTSRGCPFDCVFCGNMTKKVRYRPIEIVKEEINDLKDLGFESIYFTDDVFTIKKDRMETITKDINTPFRVTTRADLLDEDKIKILAKNGCEWLSLGIESGNDDILKRSNKGMTKQDNEEAVSLANKYGIKTKGFFIIGLPGETEKTAKQTIDFSKSLKKKGLTDADFYYLVPFPGTSIWQNPEMYGIKINDRNFTKYLQAGKKARCVIETEELSSSRIEELVMEAKQSW